jgi:hypothetical protein
LGFHGLLRVAHQRVGALCFESHALDGRHDVLRLREEGVAQFSGPLDVFRKAHDQLRHGDQALDAGIPWLILDGIRERLVLQIRIPCQPLLELDNF